MRLLQRYYADVTKNWTINPKDTLETLDSMGMELPRVNSKASAPDQQHEANLQEMSPADDSDDDFTDKKQN